MIHSKAQARAMYAAAAGNSNIGIPKKVGQEAISTPHASIKKMPERKAAPKKESPPKKKPPAPRHFGSLAPHDQD